MSLLFLIACTVVTQAMQTPVLGSLFHVEHFSCSRDNEVLIAD